MTDLQPGGVISYYLLQFDLTIFEWTQCYWDFMLATCIFLNIKYNEAVKS